MRERARQAARASKGCQRRERCYQFLEILFTLLIQGLLILLQLKVKRVHLFPSHMEVLLSLRHKGASVVSYLFQ